jgi:hypothetical protein|tara:strand:+ start:4632 stop:4988 length:357 start_codon:yes stop_codon:yes gene_type:complete
MSNETVELKEEIEQLKFKNERALEIYHNQRKSLYELDDLIKRLELRIHNQRTAITQKDKDIESWKRYCQHNYDTLNSQFIIAYREGWLEAAEWAKREDLNWDIGSPAFIDARKMRIGR